MKLKLPKLLLGAIVALSTIAQGVTLSPSLFAVDPEEYQDEYWQKKEYTGGSLTVCGDVRFPVVYDISTDVSTSFEWNTNGTNVVLSGIGHIYPQILSGDLFVDFTVNLDHYDYENEIVPTRHFSVNKYITFDNVNLQFSNKSGSQKIVDIDAKLGNDTFLKAWSNNVILDLTDARFDYASIYAESCTIQSSNLVINNKLILEVDGGSVNLRGNLTLSGGGILPGPSGRMNAWALGSDWTSGAWKNYWGGRANAFELCHTSSRFRHLKFTLNLH